MKLTPRFLRTQYRSRRRKRTCPYPNKTETPPVVSDQPSFSPHESEQNVDERVSSDRINCPADEKSKIKSVKDARMFLASVRQRKSVANPLCEDTDTDEETLPEEEVWKRVSSFL